VSAKWVRSKAWDDAHLTGALLPVKWVLRALSSITLAVTLLVLVTIYGVLASIPIGLLASVPTYLFYGLTLVLVAVVLPAVFAIAIGRRVPLRGQGAGFATGLLTFLPLAGLMAWAWVHWALPRLSYNSVTGEGVRFFASFVERYKSIPMRRIPGMEMSELEFYAWWPLTLVLLIFVLNMVVTTLRRIEFRFENLGVLSVHTGIVVISLGSAFYAAGKREGDMLLQAGPPDAATGRITPGPPESTFFDNTRIVLKVDQGRGPEQWALEGVPRYNDYNLQVAGGAATEPVVGAPGDEGRTLGFPVIPPEVSTKAAPRVDRDIGIDVVGYASYAKVAPRWSAGAPASGELPNPLRTVELTRTAPNGSVDTQSFDLLPGIPAERVSRPGQGSVVMQYTIGMPDERWEELSAVLPDRATWGLIVEVPALNVSRVYSVQRGQRILIGPSTDQPAFTLTIQDLLDQTSMPVITRGFEGATTSVAIVRVEPGPGAPALAAGTAAGAADAPFTRYTHSLFPEIDQDMSDERTERGTPKRSAPDARIRLRLIDANTASIFLDESPATAPGAPANVRAIVRLGGAPPVRTESLAAGATLPLVRDLGVRRGASVAHAFRELVPTPVPLLERETGNVGNHKRAALAVRVTMQGKPGWSRVQWLPFVEYYGTAPGEQTVALPDGRSIRVAFSRHEHPLPGMILRLIDFEMFPYPHSTQPRDFRSMLQVVRGAGLRELFNEMRFRGVDQSIESAIQRGKVSATIAGTSMNEPLLIGPYMWDDSANFATNSLGWLSDRVGPFRYKFAQAGWDNSNWMQTLEASKRGEAKEPFARFTILGVGNNPGIAIIAGGAVLMALGIPWAFYLKPWLLRRKKKKVQEALASGQWKRPERKNAGVKAQAFGS